MFRLMGSIFKHIYFYAEICEVHGKCILCSSRNTEFISTALLFSNVNKPFEILSMQCYLGTLHRVLSCFSCQRALNTNFPWQFASNVML